MAPVDVRCEPARARPYGARLRADAAALLRTTRLARCELSLMLVGDREIRALNRAFRGKDRPTDVLSFSQCEEAPKSEDHPGAAARGACAPCTLGDVVISIDTARRQASRLMITPSARLRALLIHGFLHLLGYDHERSAAEAQRMFARERELDARLTRRRSARGARSRRPRRAL